MNMAQQSAIDTGTRRRRFAGFRPLSGFGLLRMRTAQHRSISLPESNCNLFLNTYLTLKNLSFVFFLSILISIFF